MLAALVVLTLFIGVVTTSMDEASEDMKTQIERESRTKHVVALAAERGEPLSPAEVELYKQVGLRIASTRY